MNIDPRIFDIEESIREDSDRVSAIIARHLDIDGQDHAWLVHCLADLIYNPENRDAMANLVVSLEHHIDPLITQEAVNELERAGDPA